MKTTIKTMIVGLVVIMIGLIGFVSYTIIDTGSFNFTFSGKSNIRLSNTQTIEMQDIDTISITGYACDVIFYQSDTTEIIVKEYRSDTSKKESFLTIDKTATTCEIEAEKQSNYFTLFGFGNNKYRYIEVYLPKEFKGTLDTKTKSGDITVKVDLYLDKIQLESASGYIEGKTIESPNIKMTTTSGDIMMQALLGNKVLQTSSGYIIIDKGTGNTVSKTSSGDITLNRMSGEINAKTSSGYIYVEGGEGKHNFSTTSGDVTIKDIKGYIKASCKSGYMYINNFSGNGKFNTSSGDMNLDVSLLDGNLDVFTSSGYVDLKIPNDTQFALACKTDSGEIRTSFEEQVNYNKNQDVASATIGDGSKKMNISTKSGDIDIRK